jgi:hypothetical protein
MLWALVGAAWLLVSATTATSGTSICVATVFAMLALLWCQRGAYLELIAKRYTATDNEDRP